MATHSRTHSAGDRCQSFRCHQPDDFFTSCIPHPCLWRYPCCGPHNVQGQNGLSPCRTCNIKGISVSRTYYVPLQRNNIPRTNPQQYDPSDLPTHTHEDFLEQAHAVEMAPSNSMCGIKGIPVLSCISLLFFPSSFPFNFMHLIWENLIPNLILFWTGEFKDLDHQNKSYVIAPHIWNAVGVTTAASGVTIPAAFGASVPNIVTKQSQMSAEMYSNWTLYIAPIVLRGRFKKTSITCISCSLSKLSSCVWHSSLMRWR